MDPLTATLVTLAGTILAGTGGAALTHQLDQARAETAQLRSELGQARAEVARLRARIDTLTRTENP